MKKLLLALSLVSLLSVSAQAATSADLQLQGTVEADMHVSFEPTPAALALVLKSSAEQPIGKLKYQSNSPLGFEISFSSTESGQMKHSNGTDFIGYELKTASEQLVKRGVIGGIKIQSALGIPVNIEKDMVFVSENIMVVPGLDASQLVAGTYTDTVHASIASK